MMNMDQYRSAMAALPEDIRWAEVNAQQNESVLLGVSGGEVTRTAASQQTALYVRACGERSGIAYTQDSTQEPAQLIRQAVENGRFGEGAVRDVLAQQRVAHDGKAYPDADLQVMTDVANQINRLALAKSEAIGHVAAEVRVDTLHSAVINNKGLDVDSSHRLYCAKVSVMGQKNGRQYNANAHVTAETPEQLNLDAAAMRATQALNTQYDPRDLQSGYYPAVLDSSVVINILTTAWQLFSGVKMNNGSSALSGLLGNAIGSEAVNITDSPTREGCGYRFALDHEGATAPVNVLVRNGMLENLLHTQATAKIFETAPTGNSGRVALLTGSIPTELIPVPRILCLEPGQNSKAELLRSMGDGLLIAQSFDVFHSINIGSGDFSIPCRGSVVKNGQCQYNVTGLTLSGNLKELLRQVEETGSDLWIDEFLLKSYCIGAPSIRLAGVQVNGKG